MLPYGQVRFITHLLEPGGRWKREGEKDKQTCEHFYAIYLVAAVQQREKGKYKRSSMLGNDTYPKAEERVCLTSSLMTSYLKLQIADCDIANLVKWPQTCFPDRKDASQLLCYLCNKTVMKNDLKSSSWLNQWGKLS